MKVNRTAMIQLAKSQNEPQEFLNAMAEKAKPVSVRTFPTTGKAEAN